MTVTNSQVAKMMEVAKTLPADGNTYLLPGYGIRAMHSSRNAMTVEYVIVQKGIGEAYRALRPSPEGKWGRRHEVAFGEWGKICLFISR